MPVVLRPRNFPTFHPRQAERIAVNMPKRGIHPKINFMTLVQRDGATVLVQTILKATRPLKLQIVRSALYVFM